MRSALALASFALTACGCDQTATPAPRSGVVLEIDGIEVRDAELKPLLDYIEASGERTGRNFAMQIVLERHVLPLRVAQRAFAAQRAELKVRADAFLRSVIDSGGADPQLRSKGQLLGGETSPGLLSRTGMDLAQAAYCFVADNLGVVSPVIELPRGYCVVSFSDHKPGVERSGDLVNAYQVPFYTHTRLQFEDWWAAQKKALADKLTYLHPDYADALPPWIKRIKP